jgi:dolichol kinase
MKKLIDYLKRFFLKSSDESSKRLNGTIAFLAVTFVICAFEHQYLRELLYTAAALLGLGITDSLISKIKEK